MKMILLETLLPTEVKSGQKDKASMFLHLVKAW